MPTFHAFFRAAALAALGVWASAAAAAEKYPDHPIELIIPFAPGDTDMMMRPITDKMGEFLGHPVVITYKPGAGGGVGAGQVARGKPDGYLLVGSSPGSLVVVPLANKAVAYTTESFAPVAAISEGGMMLVAPAASRYKTVADLVAHAKKDPGGITFSTSGAMGITHLLAEIFSQKAGIKLRHIPYQGSGPAVTALLGGNVDITSTAIAPAQAHIKSGVLRPLAVFSDQRLKAYPDVPTLKELGYDIGSPTLYGIMAPKDTPPAIVDAFYAAARKVVEKYGAQLAPVYAGMGAQIHLLGPKEYKTYLQGQAKMFGAGIDALNR
jgi:tripartite-type tricarboxylate transporter receptor subunit TctC